MTTNWEPTRKGGFRRQPQAGVAQQLGNQELEDRGTEAAGSADPKVEEAWTPVSTLEERLRGSRAHNAKEGGGSNPSPGTRNPYARKWGTGLPSGVQGALESAATLLQTHGVEFHSRERLGLDTCPYLIRWRLETSWGSVRLHHWLAQDDPRHRHDHPWNFVTFVLKGGYTDLSPSGDSHLRAPAVQYRDATHQHTVVPDEGGAWTIIVTGPKIRRWGFWVNGSFKSHIKYFWKFGHHPCD